LVVLGNHLHLLAVVDNPDVIASFMDKVKTELAHAVNRLLGRRKRTLWCDGYDAVPVLTLEDAISKFVYLYANPQQAGLERTIDKYPGFSTWEMFLSETHSLEAPWIHRPSIGRLATPAVSEREDAALVERLRAENKELFTFSFNPQAWLKCFNILPTEWKRMKERIVSGVREVEAKLNETRTGDCIGAERLKRAPIDQPYVPQKFTPRRWCICRDISLRTQFIAQVKALIKQGRDVYERWKRGDFSIPYPPELFAPRVPRPSSA
jgi:hypothetical protein